ncbi:MAG: TRAP transporter small permease subunit [Pseudomonadota bacterium]
MLLRAFAWSMVALTAVFVLNAFVTFWLGWPGAAALFSGEAEGGSTALAGVQLVSYIAGIVLPLIFAQRTPDRTLREDAAVMARIVRVIIRFAFWAVLLVGLADIIVSFLRVEEMLADFVGEERAASWGFNANRAPELHLPLIGVALILAFITPTLGFHWLALFVVLAELLIVFTRFVFSYEQAFQADLVRFWYGALFLFASAHTLVEDGHVRVDVFYAAMRRKTQGAVNALGCVVMGILFCWVILYFGLATSSSVISAPLLSLEVTQAGFGMYVKYLMAGFLGVFGVTMMIQFSAYLLESWADWRGDPGGAEHHVHGHDGEHVTEV